MKEFVHYDEGDVFIVDNEVYELKDKDEGGKDSNSMIVSDVPNFKEATCVYLKSFTLKITSLLDDLIFFFV